MTLRQKLSHIDWIPVICWAFLAIFGMMNIFSSTFTDEVADIFSFSLKSGHQFVWILTGLFFAFLIIFVLPTRLYIGLSWWFYLITVCLLVAVLIVGKEINGAKSWLMLGGFGIQPSELSKLTTSLVLATIMGRYDFKLSSFDSFSQILAVVFIPVALIALEPDMGTILVYCSFLFVFFREGMSGGVILFALLCILLFVVTLKYSPYAALVTLCGIFGAIHSMKSDHPLRVGILCLVFVIFACFFPELYELPSCVFLSFLKPEYWLLILCVLASVPVFFAKKRKRVSGYFLLCLVCSVALIFSVRYIFDEILQQHHRDRIENLLGITEDLKGAGYNVHQSEIAIGSGGFFGKGYLDGTQTKFNFVPEQSTDFIFCTVGEEWGLLGSLAVLAAYLAIIISILNSAERQKDASFRVYGYCVASIFFAHVFVNVGMTVGIMPVVGIPLPFMSYGGSSFLAFTILLFIYLRMDLERWS